MAATRYQYSIQTDFPNHEVNSTMLVAEIGLSSITVALDHIDTADGDCDIWFKTALSGGEEAILDGVVAAHTDGAAAAAADRVIVEKPVNAKLTLNTPNWCDDTTWYPLSEFVEDEVATDSGDHTTYTLAHEVIIDLYHGKLTFEDFLKDSDGKSYRVAVKVNGSTKAERDPHVGSGGDFVVDYVEGSITFASALQPADVVLVTYHYANGSMFILAPTAGKHLVLEKVEAHISEDIVMLDSIGFQAYGLVDVFAPQLMPGVPSGTKIPIGDPLVYKTILDLINDSNKSFPAYPVLGGSGWRGSKKPAYVFAWDYDVGVTELCSTVGLEIHVGLQHDVKCGGSFASATFYCFSKDEDET